MVAIRPGLPVPVRHLHCAYFILCKRKASTMMHVIAIAAILLVLLQWVDTGILGDDDQVVLVVQDYYKEKCPWAEDVVRHNVEAAVLKDPRMAASLLRLHFHDCFVMGCDASVLLDSHGGMVSEKEAGPNLGSLRGFEVIDSIKSTLEEACPLTVSCADILAMAARDAVALRGGPTWKVLLGRKDSVKASFDGANKLLPAPNSSLETLISNFKQQGLHIGDLVALSGSHTMGKARCLSFRQEIHDPDREDYPDKYERRTTFRRILRSICPESGGDNALAPLDFNTPARFDNHYFINVLEGRGLLGSDNVLVAEERQGQTRQQVFAYASNQDLFFASFVKSMIKMGNINVLTGDDGEIRKHCRFTNSDYQEV